MEMFECDNRKDNCHLIGYQGKDSAGKGTKASPQKAQPQKAQRHDMRSPHVRGDPSRNIG